MPAYMTSDELRIPISAAYLEGRQAFADGVDYWANPYGHGEGIQRMDWHIGFSDAESGVSIEFRQEAEENGGYV